MEMDGIGSLGDQLALGTRDEQWIFHFHVNEQESLLMDRPHP